MVTATKKTRATGNGSRQALDFEEVKIQINAPRFMSIPLKIRGTTYYMQKRIGETTIENMIDTQTREKNKAEKKVRKPKDFDKLYDEALYQTSNGGHGIPAAAFRKAMIQSTRMIEYNATNAKMAFIIEADDYDKRRGEPLVYITTKQPEKCIMPVRLETGVMDLCIRPRWEIGWEATVRIRYDADALTETEVTNLLYRAGQQIGIGEMRNFVSPKKLDSVGGGYGLFEIVNK